MNIPKIIIPSFLVLLFITYYYENSLSMIFIRLDFIEEIVVVVNALSSD